MNNKGETAGTYEINPARLVLYRMTNSPFTDVSETYCDANDIIGNGKFTGQAKANITRTRSKEEFEH